MKLLSIAILLLFFAPPVFAQQPDPKAQVEALQVALQIAVAQRNQASDQVIQAQVEIAQLRKRIAELEAKAAEKN